MRLVIVATAVALAALYAAPADAGQTDPAIIGHVWKDADANGQADPGPGLHGSTLRLLDAGDDVVAETPTGFSGDFAFYNIAPGNYTLEVTPAEFAQGLCIDSFGGFFPYRLDDCIIPLLPWVATTPSSQPVTVSAGQMAIADFLARPADAQLFAGVALLEDGYPAVGTAIVARANGVECGVALVSTAGGDGIHNFELTVFGAGERPGCAQPGDTVTFEVGGLPADEAAAYAQTTQYFTGQNLTAVHEYAWFWAEERAYESVAAAGASMIQAIIGGKVCAETPLLYGHHVFVAAVGFVRLAVPSVAVEPGCGSPGATVEFRVNGEPAADAATWESAVKNVHLRTSDVVVQGDADCSRSVDSGDALQLLLDAAALPTTGQCIYEADVNCDANRDSVDALLVLLYTSRLPFTQPATCTPIGEP